MDKLKYLTPEEWEALSPSMKRWRTVFLAKTLNISFTEAEQILEDTIRKVNTDV